MKVNSYTEFMNSIFNGPYADFGTKHRDSYSKHVLHQQTCPRCGKTLVNLYKKNGIYACRTCQEEEKCENV